mmetsp:Transcript_28137/g.59193  ORF Transcript_28137/g.59193 Transcript_28137/m.59193 type:complete len:89 (+) Transcript_28137:999-1265(+)
MRMIESSHSTVMIPNGFGGRGGKWWRVVNGPLCMMQLCNLLQTIRVFPDSLDSLVLTYSSYLIQTLIAILKVLLSKIGINLEDLFPCC